MENKIHYCTHKSSKNIIRNIKDYARKYNAQFKEPVTKETLNYNLEAMAKQLFDYWFVQFDFPDENGKPYKSSGGKMVWNEKLKREIPAIGV